jgi:uncharacterized membrane protein YfcA
MHYLLLTILGLLAGILSGFLGIGGGTVLVPFLVSLGYSPVQAAATSSLAVAITATSGSIQNLRMGQFSFKKVASLGFPALVMSQLGVYWAHQMDAHLLMISFDMLLLLNIYLVELRKRLIQKQKSTSEKNIFDLFTQTKKAKIEISVAGFITIMGGLIILFELLILGQPIEASFQVFSQTVKITPFQIIVFGILILLFRLCLDLPTFSFLSTNRLFPSIDYINRIFERIDLFGINHLIQLRKLLNSNEKNKAEELIKALASKTELDVFRPKFNAFISYLIDAKSEIVVAGISTFIAGIITWAKLSLSNTLLEAVVRTSFGVFTVTPFQIIILGILLLVIINILEFIQRLTFLEESKKARPKKIKSIVSRIFTGGIAGLLAGLFGVGGGVILVPLQLLLLNEPLKTAIRTSLGVIIITSISSCLGHALSGNLLFIEGLLVGMGGLVGAHTSSGFLPKLSEQFISIAFRTMLASLFVYTAFLAVSMGKS